MGLHRPEVDDSIDQSAIEQVRSNNPDAFSGIVSRYAPILYSLAFRMLGADEDMAREVVQEIFLKIYRALPSYDCRKRFFPWLYTVALNHLRSLRRAQRSGRKRTIVPLEAVAGGEITDGGPRPDDLAVAREGERLAQRALDALPGQLREVFLLRHVEGLSTQEAAEIMGVTESTVRTWLFRARARLKAMLLDSGWEGSGK